MPNLRTDFLIGGEAHGQPLAQWDKREVLVAREGEEADPAPLRYTIRMVNMGGTIMRYFAYELISDQAAFGKLSELMFAKLEAYVDQ